VIIAKSARAYGGNWSQPDLQDQKQNGILEAVMHSSRKERARASPLLEAPISNDADISKLEKQAADYLVEAGRVSPAAVSPDVLATIAQDYFAHALRNERRRAR
jgi:hypothetical protein